MKTTVSSLLAALLLYAALPHPARSGALPSHPAKLSYQALDWQVPEGASYRDTLANGLTVYMAQDETFPLVHLIGYVRFGSIALPAEKQGLGELMTQLLATGGTERFSADSIDQLLDTYAISFSTNLGQTMLKFSLSCLAEYTDTALTLLQQMLFAPRFDQKRFDKEQQFFVQSLRHRFDNPVPILKAAYGKALYPNEAFSALADEKSVAAFTVEDVRALHKQVFSAPDILVGISGKFDKQSMQSRLSTMFPTITPSSNDSVFPKVQCAPELTKLIVHRDGLTQSQVRMSLPLFTRPHPDYYALSVLNTVLGGGAFSSRLNEKIRSDAGLTYSIYSDVISDYVIPGTFYIQFHTNTASTIRAITMARQELRTIVQSAITPQELEHAKKVLIDGLPSMFRGKTDIIDNYTWSYYYGREDDHFRTYANKINALTAEQILDAAKRHLDPDKLVYTVVTDTAVIKPLDTAPDFSLLSGQGVRIETPESLSRLP